MAGGGRRRRGRPVFLAAPTSSDARLAAVAEAGRGFVYAQASLGVTGLRASLRAGIEQLVGRVGPTPTSPSAPASASPPPTRRPPSPASPTAPSSAPRWSAASATPASPASATSPPSSPTPSTPPAADAVPLPGRVADRRGFDAAAYKLRHAGSAGSSRLCGGVRARRGAGRG